MITDLLNNYFVLFLDLYVLPLLLPEYYLHE